MNISAPRRLARLILPLLFAALTLLPAFAGAPALWTARAQQPTGSIPTVTGTAVNATVKVYSDRNIIEVYAGPSSYLYPPIGILMAGETAPALGYSLDGNWIQIVYLGAPEGVGWIYAPFVSLSLRPGATLPVLPAPPTATPRVTPTINPTSAAAYGLELTPGRLPTFTQPPPLELPQFESGASERTGLPVGMVVLLLALVGILVAVISFVRGGR